MTEKQEEQIQTAIRLSKPLIARIDKLAERMSEPNMSPVTRSELIRRFVLDGTELMERKKR